MWCSNCGKIIRKGVAMKIFKMVIGIFLVLVGITMTVFSWLFFYKEETAIIQLASLYVALFISTLITAIGGICISFRKE